MTQHLFELGRRRVDLLLDEDSHSKSGAILQGYRAACAQAGLPAGQVHTAEDSLRGGYLAARRLFATGSLPTRSSPRATSSPSAL